MNKEHIAKRLRELRGYTPRRVVCEELGISEVALTSYESGKRIPRDEIKVRLAAYYKTTVSDIFFSD